MIEESMIQMTVNFEHATLKQVLLLENAGFPVRNQAISDEKERPDKLVGKTLLNGSVFVNSWRIEDFFKIIKNFNSR